MPTKTVDGYEIEYTAEPLEGCDQWGAYVAIFMPSDNPMHMNNVYPKQRVAADVALATEAAAEAEAEKSAVEILTQLRTAPHAG
ncbi:hypothetical protein [Duganella aceris]|jgi:hypothetical protein|uniref:Uncharacterized protein n=1 Tax=Duganella aceris TaxID=2703883 RepID=A0ABX0FSF3_9BURK|nr:hypothetical protein [Duganella aceris]NGZ87345.1 hypothetical protein [Duganella aceris]